MKSARAVRLGDVCEVVRGVRVTRKDLAPSGQYPVYQNSLKPLGMYNDYNCEGNNPFMIMALAAGEVAWSESPFWAADDCTYFRNLKGMDARYLYYLLRNSKNELMRHVNQATIPRLSNKILENLVIPLPPLATQHAIVARLDSALARAGALEERFAAIAQNAELSFKATLAETFEKVEANKTPFENCCRLLRGTYTTQNAETPGDIPVILGGREPAYYIARSNHDGPCLVVSRSGASAGYISQWNQPIFVTDGFIIEMGDAIDFDYAYFFFKSAQNLLNGLKQGGAIPHVTGTLIKQICIPLPSLATQRSIVSRLDAARKRADGISALARQAAEAAANLKKALLKEAFE